MFIKFITFQINDKARILVNKHVVNLFLSGIFPLVQELFKLNNEEVGSDHEEEEEEFTDGESSEEEEMEAKHEMNDGKNHVIDDDDEEDDVLDPTQLAVPGNIF